MRLPTNGSSFDHQVQFYESDDFICEIVADYVVTGLQSAQSLVLVVTDQHRSKISRLLASSAFFDAAASNIHWFDARQLLSMFMDGAFPNANQFKSYMGRVLEESRTGHGYAPIRVYDELVDLLALGSNLEAAVRLEQLWNELGATSAFSLLCAYTNRNFHCGAQWGHLDRICNQHKLLRFDNGIPFEDQEKSA
jgi:hypothetical protein